MRTVVEIVTCDKCGEVRQFEKYNEASKLFRVETLSEWIRGLGWSTTDGLQHLDLCPVCSKKGK